MPISIVTGGSGALGSSVARALAKRGHTIVLADSPRSKERLEPLAKELKAKTCAVDLATADGWKEVMATAGEASCAALVAGAWKGGMDEDAWSAMMTANVETVYRGFRALLPGMQARKNGSIVVVGSRNVERPWTGKGSAEYTASKAAAVAMAQAASAEVLEHGVRINAVLPSTMDTAANRKSMPDADVTRWVTTPSAAGVVAFLLSDAARDISGAAIPLYGRA